MKQEIKSRLFFALVISLLILACNSGSDQKSKMTDSTATKTDNSTANIPDSTMDASKVASGIYKVVADTMGIRVLEANYKPGDSSPMHAHPDVAAYMAAGGTAEFISNDGKKNKLEFKTGTSMIMPATIHSVKNTGETALKVILVEVNRPSGKVLYDKSMDVTNVAPEEYKLKGDTMGIRVLEVAYKPGQSSTMHAHPDNAIYVVEGGTAEFTGTDGKKTVSELKTGASMIRPGGIHSVKNTGKTTLKVILVEVSRPTK